MFKKPSILWVQLGVIKPKLSGRSLSSNTPRQNEDVVSLLFFDPPHGPFVFSMETAFRLIHKRIVEYL